MRHQTFNLLSGLKISLRFRVAADCVGSRTQEPAASKDREFYAAAGSLSTCRRAVVKGWEPCVLRFSTEFRRFTQPAAEGDDRSQ
jgi:hypothetical protein